jgi:hypothetical protein
MLKGEDIRKLSDVDLEFYMLGVEELERERDSLLKNNLTVHELMVIATVLSGKILESKSSKSIEDKFFITEVEKLLEKVRKM